MSDRCNTEERKGKAGDEGDANMLIEVAGL